MPTASLEAGGRGGETRTSGLPAQMHPRAAARLAGTLDAELAPVSRVAAPEAVALEQGAYRDDAAYLEHQLLRLRAHVEAAVAASAGDAIGKNLALARGEELAGEIAARIVETTAAGRTLGLEVLRARFGLDDFEVDAMLHALAPSLDPSILKLNGRLTGVAWRSWVDVGFVIHVHFPSVAERLRARCRFAPDGRLLAERLVHLDRTRPDARSNLLACEIKLPARVARVILGQDANGGVTEWSSVEEPAVSLESVILPEEIRADLISLLDSHAGLPARLAAWGFDEVMPNGRGTVLLLSGPPGTGKSTLARAVATRLRKRLLVVDAGKFLEAARAMDDQVEELLQEARLQDAVVLFDECEGLFGARDGGNRTLGTMLRALDRFQGLAVLATNVPERLDPAVDRRVLLRLSLDVPTPELRERIWRHHLPPETPLSSDIDLAHLAKRYDFSGGYIRNAVLLAVSRALARTGDPAAGDARLSLDDLERAAQAQLRGDLSGFAERTRSNLSLDVLVLTAEVRAQIVEIIAAGKNRSQVLYGWGFNETVPSGKGQIVLLSGDPGTGKTLAAEVIAAELGMTLYRINPAKVVSKYVGETERNLNEVLTQARSMRAILFFDEADSLFAARVSKVETANDRFVNMETNFLLQQLERYEGIVILATNLETSIDQAFKRRIHYNVVIPFPDAASRERIWRGVMPARAPASPDINYAKLGKTFDLSGGHIKNAVMRAAYMAAQVASPITQSLLADAAEKECVAAGKLFQHI